MAGKFTFRLDVLLRLRKRKRDQQQREVAEALRRVAELEERITFATAMLKQETERTREAKQDDRLDLASLRGRQYYRVHLHGQIRQAELELAGRRTEVDAARERLAEASKELKVIEKLREKRWQQYVEELRRGERIGADETASVMYHRRLLELHAEETA